MLSQTMQLCHFAHGWSGVGGGGGGGGGGTKQSLGISPRVLIYFFLQFLFLQQDISKRCACMCLSMCVCLSVCPCVCFTADMCDGTVLSMAASTEDIVDVEEDETLTYGPEQ